MDEFIEYLGHKRAHYFYMLYKNRPAASRKEECLSRMLMIDEYNLLLEIINRLPLEIKRQVDKEWEDHLAILES